MNLPRAELSSPFLRDLVGSASVDRPPPGAKARALERLGLEARGTAWPRKAAGAVLVTALAAVFGAGLRAAPLGASGDRPALSTLGTTPECAGGLEAPQAPGSECPTAIPGAGSSSGSTAPGSSGG